MTAVVKALAKYSHRWALYHVHKAIVHIKDELIACMEVARTALMFAADACTLLRLPCFHVIAGPTHPLDLPAHTCSHKCTLECGLMTTPADHRRGVAVAYHDASAVRQLLA